MLRQYFSGLVIIFCLAGCASALHENDNNWVNYDQNFPGYVVCTEPLKKQPACTIDADCVQASGGCSDFVIHKHMYSAHLKCENEQFSKETEHVDCNVPLPHSGFAKCMAGICKEQ